MEILIEFAFELAAFFKTSIRSGKQPLSIQKVRILEYSNTHASPVCVKYGGGDEQWTKFELDKRGNTDPSV